MLYCVCCVVSVVLCCLQPSDGYDVDMFLTVEGDGEPGRDNFDYESMNWGSNVDQIRIEPGMKHFCLSCTMYIAVSGFHAGHYSITAVSQGITQLQMGYAVGGHSNTDALQYYTVRNSDPFAVLSFTLTSISGDADLYITSFLETADGNGDADLVLPTRTVYTWHAVYYGDDSLTIDYTDPHFCSACIYIVGIYGYRNSTFTLLVTEKEDSVVRLVPNRPQVASLADLGEIRYFTAQLSSSAEDITFSLTPLDTGYADMYVQQYNISYYESQVIAGTLQLPDPHYSNTYIGSFVVAVVVVVVVAMNALNFISFEMMSFLFSNSLATTFYDETNMIYIPGPHRERTVFIVAVFALSSVRFSIVATLSQFPITLQVKSNSNLLLI